MSYKNIISFFGTFLPLLNGSFATFYMKSYTSPVIASCLSSLILINFCWIFLKTNKYDALIFCGSFIAMGHIENQFYLLTASLLSTFALIRIKDHFDGYGGKLGTIAFIGCTFNALLGLI